MKRVKSYTKFLESQELVIFPYPEKQIIKHSQTSILLIPGGDSGNPDNDFSSIAPKLCQMGYNVYSLNWPSEINLNEFSKRVASQIYQIRTPFVIAGYSFGFPIAWKISKEIESNELFQKLLFSIDGTMLVDNLRTHMFNSISGNPPRKLTAKSLRCYKLEQKEDYSWEKTATDNDIKQFYYEWNPKISLEEFQELKENPETVKEGQQIIWNQSCQKEYDDWKNKQKSDKKIVIEFFGSNPPTLNQIEDLTSDKKQEDVWIVCDREKDKFYEDGKPLYVNAVKSAINFFDKQSKKKTGFILNPSEKLSRTDVINIVAENLKNGKQSKVDNNSVSVVSKDGKKMILPVDMKAKSQKLIVVKDCDHNSICDTKSNEVCSIVAANFKSNFNIFIYHDLIPTGLELEEDDSNLFKNIRRGGADKLSKF